MPKHKYDDVFIRVGESRTLYAGNSEPCIERDGSIQRWHNGKNVSVAVYRNISEASVFRLVRLQDKLAEQRKAEPAIVEDEDDIPF